MCSGLASPLRCASTFSTFTASPSEPDSVIESGSCPPLALRIGTSSAGGIPSHCSWNHRTSRQHRAPRQQPQPGHHGASYLVGQQIIEREQQLAETERAAAVVRERRVEAAGHHRPVENAPVAQSRAHLPAALEPFQGRQVDVAVGDDQLCGLSLRAADGPGRRAQASDLGVEQGPEDL
eukprot:2954671-Rhodomonas_salina.1